MKQSVDAVVVGGGTAGLNAALQLARTGRSVALLERRAEGTSGARWVNGVLDWQFERAGLEPSAGAERLADNSTAWMVSPSGRYRFAIRRSPVVEADMRELVQRLTNLAIDAGVDIRWGTDQPVLDFRFGRPGSVDAQCGHSAVHFDADLFVDASGRAGVLRRQSGGLAELCPPASPASTCVAQQLVLEVADRDGALEFCDANGVQPGEAVVQIGLEGGYSTLNIRVEPDLHAVSVLTGSIPSLGYASGPAMVRAARETHRWMGPTIFGGSGHIPLRRVYDRFTAPGLALVGDAACQVMPAHGSGIGFGMIAAKVLAEAVANADDPGSPDTLWSYQANFLREFGATLAGYDAIRRMSVTLGSKGAEELFSSGVFSEPLVRNGLDQKLGSLPPTTAGAAALALAKRPHLAKVVAPALAYMGAARGVYSTYPRRNDPRSFERWLKLGEPWRMRQS